MTTEASSRLLDRVRKLLAKAEDESVTPPEAQALTAKAAELMAKYGIDRALLAADRPETDAPSSRMLDIDNPWARVKAHLLCGLGSALRCQCIMLPTTDRACGSTSSATPRTSSALDVLYTSVLIQMWHGLAGAQVPAWSPQPAGLAASLAARLRRRGDHAGPRRRARGQADAQAHRRRPRRGLAGRAGAGRPGAGDPRTMAERAYPLTRTARVTYSGTGYRDGYAKGQRADIGTRRVTHGRGRALARAR